MTFSLIYTAIMVILMTAVLIKEVIKPEIAVFSALLLLVLGGVITIDEAVRGFSNKGMLTVAFLFVVSATLQASGTFDKFVSKVLGSNKGKISTKYLRLMFPVAGFSAFLNNTPIVASLIPVVKNWTKKVNLPSTKFLIPLSYAAIFGGICTLIGTSTNLVVHGMMLDRNMRGFSFFEITKVSLPLAIIGILFVAFIGHKLLPERKEQVVELGENTREFVVELKVTTDYPNIGKSIEEANLRHLQGLFLFQINRGDEIIAPVSHSEKILSGDRLFFTGVPETIYEIQKTPGLVTVKDIEFDLQNIDSDKLNTYEAVISNNSSLIGQTVRDSNFRDKYDAVILAIHRAGTRINKKVGDIVFKQGDTLFILAKKGFDKKWYNSKDFSLVSQSLDVYSKPKWKGNLALGILAAMVLSAVLGIAPMILAAAFAATLLVIFGVISSNDAIKSVNWGVLLIIASSLGIGRALENSGLATLIANVIISSLHVFGPIGIIAGIFFLTSIYTELITNNAAAAIMFPIALATANLLNYDPRPLFITLAIGASASFATPIGYQTNLMVYGAGRYKFNDFFKIGIPMNIFVGIMVTIIVYLMFFI